jgi:DNA primase
MNIAQLKKEIIEQPELIEVILEKIGFVKIRDYGNEYRCAKDADSNPTGVVVRKDNLFSYVRSSSKDLSGDIFTLAQHFKGMKFPEAIKFICSAIGKNPNEYNKNENAELPFGGYYKGIKDGESFQPLQIYPQETMDEFINIPSKMFYDDGINFEAQEQFDIRFDEHHNRVAVAWRNAIGEIIGIMGRYNNTAEICKEHGIPKWFPIIPFSKKQALFGFSENYNTLVDKKVVYIGESEKFPLQLLSMKVIPYEKMMVNLEGKEQLFKGKKGIELGVAVGTHSISKYQRILLHSIFPERIIICFDEGLDVEEVKKEAMKVKLHSTTNVTCKVGYIHDKENKYLPKDSKASPSDFGYEIFEKLVSECVVWV